MKSAVHQSLDPFDTQMYATHIPRFIFKWRLAQFAVSQRVPWSRRPCSGRVLHNLRLPSAFPPAAARETTWLTVIEFQTHGLIQIQDCVVRHHLKVKVSQFALENVSFKYKCLRSMFHWRWSGLARETDFLNTCCKGFGLPQIILQAHSPGSTSFHASLLFSQHFDFRQERMYFHMAKWPLALPIWPKYYTYACLVG
jgi:hypothetical protein